MGLRWRIWVTENDREYLEEGRKFLAALVNALQAAGCKVHFEEDNSDGKGRFNARWLLEAVATGQRQSAALHSAVNDIQGLDTAKFIPGGTGQID